MPKNNSTQISNRSDNGSSPTAGAGGFNVFVCYAPADQTFAHDLSGALKKRRRLPDTEWDTLRATANAFEQIAPRVRAAENFLFVVSPESVASALCLSLLDLALQTNRNVVPVLHRNVGAALPPQLRGIELINYRSEDDVPKAFQAVAAAVTTDLDLDVFICYSRKDQEFVNRLYKSFESVDRQCWMDLTSIPFTGKWKDEVLSGIDAADNFVFVLSPASANSRECGNELAHAIAENKRLVPILCAEVDDRDVPPELAEIQRIPFTAPNSFDAAFSNLNAALDQDLAYVREHKRLLLRANEWYANSDRSLLLMGNELSRAEELIRKGANKSPKPTARQAHYVIASREVATSSQRKRVIALVAALAVTMALAVFAFYQRYQARVASDLAITGQKEAERQKEEAQRQATIAIEQTCRANEQRGIAEFRQKEAEDQRKIATAQRKEAVHQRNIANTQTELAKTNEREAVKQLANNYLGNGLTAEKSQDWLSASHYFAKAAQISRDPEVIDRASRDVSRLNQHLALDYVKKVESGIGQLTVSPDWRRLLVVNNSSIELLDTMTGNKIGADLAQGARYPRAVFSNNGSLVATWRTDDDDDASLNSSFTIWNSDTGSPVAPAIAQPSPYTVLGASFNRDDSLLLTWGMGGARLWRTSDGKPKTEYMKHQLAWSAPPPNSISRDATTEDDKDPAQRPVCSASFSPDEKYVLTITCEGDARLWLASDASPVGPPMKPATAVSNATFSHNGKFVVLWDQDRGNPIATLWSIPEGLPVGKPIQHLGTLRDVIFSHDDKLIVTTGTDPYARLWRTSDAAPATPPLEHNTSDDGKVPSFTNDDTAILTWGDGANLWSIKRLIEMGPSRLPPGQFDDLNLILNPDKELLVEPFRDCASFEGAKLVKDEDYLLAWGTRGVSFRERERHSKYSRKVVRLDGEPYVLNANLSRNEQFIVTASNDNTARLWSAESGKPLTPQLMNSLASGAKVLVSDDDRHVITWSTDGTIRLWRTDLNVAPSAVMTQEYGIDDAVLANGDRYVITRGIDGSVQFWDASTGKATGIVIRHSNTDNRYATIRGAAVNKSRQLLLTWDFGVISLWKTADGTSAAAPINTEARVEGAAFSPDGNLVIARLADRTVRLWRTDGSPVLLPNLMQSKFLSGAAVSPDGRVVVGWGGGALQLWKTADGSRIGTELKHDARLDTDTARRNQFLMGATFSPDSKLVMSWAVDGTARLWRTSDGTPFGRPMKHSEIMAGGIFSNDGRLVLTWSMDGIARLWRTATTTPIGTTLSHGPNRQITTAAFSPDGKEVLTCGTDMTARLWRVSDGAPATPPMSHVEPGTTIRYVTTPSDFGGTFSKDGRFILTWGWAHAVKLWNRDGSPAGESQISDEAYPTGAAFSSDARFILMWGSSGARVWNVELSEPVPRPKLPLYVEVLTGTTMNAVGSLNVLTPAEWMERRRLLGNPEHDRTRKP
jgi:WD40 repeat protein